MKKIALGVFLSILVNFANAETPLTVAVYPGLDEAVKIAIPLYKKLHPEVEIQLVSQGYEEHHKAMEKALYSGIGQPDVMGVDSRYVAGFDKTGRLENLLLLPYGSWRYHKLFHRAVALIPSEEDQRYMQASVSPKTLLYREDLLHQAGLSEKDLTGSWEAFIEAGKKLKAATGACLVSDAAEIVDLYVRDQTEEKQGLYRKHAKSCTKPDNIRPPVFTKAFELALAASQAGINCGISSGSNEWREGLKQGKFASLFINVSDLGKVLSSNDQDPWRVAQLPGNSFVLGGGDFYAIPSNALHKEKAWDFIKLLTMDARVQTQWALKTGVFPALLEAQTPELMNQPMVFLGGQTARKIWQTSLKKAKVLLLDPHTSLELQEVEVFQSELYYVLSGEKTIQSVIEELPLYFSTRCRR